MSFATQIAVSDPAVYFVFGIVALTCSALLRRYHRRKSVMDPAMAAAADNAR